MTPNVCLSSSHLTGVFASGVLLTKIDCDKLLLYTTRERVQVQGSRVVVDRDQEQYTLIRASKLIVASVCTQDLVICVVDSGRW